MATYPSFEHYMELVDSILSDLFDMGSADLPDFDYASCWEEGVSARKAASLAIEFAGGF